MPKRINTVAKIGAEYIQHRLRIDEPDTKARISFAGRLIISPRWDIRVHIIPRNNSIKIFATGSILSAILSGHSSYAYDERHHFEKRYTEWLKLRFSPMIINSSPDNNAHRNKDCSNKGLVSAFRDASEK
jgi:hypothetical protein